MTDDEREKLLNRVRLTFIRALEKNKVSKRDEFILLTAMLPELMTETLEDREFEIGMQHINGSIRLSRDFFRNKSAGGSVQ